MRRALVVLVLCLLSIPAFSQNAIVNRAPDCVLQFSFATSGIPPTPGNSLAPGVSSSFDNRAQGGTGGCTIWTLTYAVAPTISAVSIEFDAAPDANGTPGNFSIWPSGSLFSGALPLTVPTYSQISGFSFAPWLQVKVNSLTGTGQIVGALNGWRNASGDSSTASIGNVTVAGNVGIIDALGNRLPTLASGPVTPSNADGVVVSYEGLTSGGITVAMTATTSTQVIAPTNGQYIYISSCTTSNASTTVSTDMILQDGSGGTTIWNFPAPAAATATTGGGGSTHSFGDHPLKVPTQGNGLYAANVTTGSSTKIFCNGFKSTVSY